MSNVKCPICGSEELDKRTVTRSLNEKFAGEAKIELVEYSCPVCGFEGDLFNENDSIVEKEIENLKTQVVVNILDDFVKGGYKLASIERVLGLPQRTLAKWKNENVAPSAAGVSLLKYIRVFPWLLEVAENDYDYAISQRIHISTAMNSLLSEMQFNNKICTKAGYIESANQTMFFAQYEHPVQAAVISQGTLSFTKTESNAVEPAVQWG